MKPIELTQLMHTVLDGEASPEETRELERLLAADSAARTQFDELRKLFGDLARMPRKFPPEGLVAAVMAAVPQRPGPDQDQLFEESGVIGASSKESRAFGSGKMSTVQAMSAPGPLSRGAKMSEQFSKRKIWIAVGAAIAAVAVAVSVGIDTSTTGKDAVGTIVPAQRYRAEQPTAADVKLGGQGTSATAPAGTVPNAGNLAGGGQAQGGNLAGGGQAQGGNLAGGGQAQGGNLAGGGQAQGGNLAGGGQAQGGNLSGGGGSRN